ncbi:hypothetical protein D3C76_1082790 [compost metagenome]
MQHFLGPFCLGDGRFHAGNFPRQTLHGIRLHSHRPGLLASLTQQALVIPVQPSELILLEDLGLLELAQLNLNLLQLPLVPALLLLSLFLDGVAVMLKRIS